MSFRDDHDAALARADALERELAATRAKLESAEAALAKPPPDPVTQERWRVRSPRTAMWFWLSFGVGALALVGVVLVLRSTPPAPKPALPGALRSSGPSRIVVADGLVEAQQAVERRHGPSRLESMSATFVEPSGTVLLDRGGRVTYRFRIIGDTEFPCVVTREISAGDWQEFDSEPCLPERPALAPRCDLAGVWRLAIERGAHAAYLASIDGLRDAAGVLTWRFRTVAHDGVVTVIDVPDDCPAL